MNEVNLLRLVADLIKSDKPTPEQVQCARTIITGLIESKQDKFEMKSSSEESVLDDEAEQARRELQ